MKRAIIIGLASVLLAGAAHAADTGVTGAGAPINNYQPSMALTQVVQRNGASPCVAPNSCGGIASNSIGSIRTFAGTYAPFGSSPADGAILSIAQDTATFSVMGTTYGGNGLTTYGLPNLVGRTINGAGGQYVHGEQFGTASNAMTLGQLETHAHGTPDGLTGLTGAGGAMDNRQPGLALNYQIAVGGIYGDGNPTIGQIGAFSGTFTPDGWMIADGQLLDVDDYSALFSLIGTTYGGDGVDVFALPDLVDRIAVGAVGDALGDPLLGQQFGSDQVFAPLAAHTHTLPLGDTDPAGGLGFFDNAQQSLAINYLIALQGIFPERTGDFPNDVVIGEIIAYAGGAGTIPDGYVLAHGQLLSIAQNQALFSVVGTTYGGNGLTTFALPDLRGRTIVGAGGDFFVGDAFGQRNSQLTIAQLAPHDHTLPDGGGAVPEPASWAMMIAGLGLTGTALRRRRAAALPA